MAKIGGGVDIFRIALVQWGNLRKQLMPQKGGGAKRVWSKFGGDGASTVYFIKDNEATRRTATASFTALNLTDADCLLLSVHFVHLLMHSMAMAVGRFS